MTDIVITSEHRVGSRWMHYLLADLLGMQKSPEMDASKLYFSENRKEIIERFKANKIVKFHHATPNQIIEAMKIAAKENDYDLDLRVLGIVRNPRDQGVSLCFHNRYHTNKGVFKEQEFETDEEALRYTIVESPWYQLENNRQRNLMIDGHSTAYFEALYNNRAHFKSFPYLWTTYERLKESTVREVSCMAQFFGARLMTGIELQEKINEHSFKTKSGRDEGKEKRSDLWRRKGIVGDWENHFDSEMVSRTQFMHDLYWKTYNKNYHI